MAKKSLNALLNLIMEPGTVKLTGFDGVAVRRAPGGLRVQLTVRYQLERRHS